MQLHLYFKFEKKYNNFLSPEPNGKGYIKLVVDFFFKSERNANWQKALDFYMPKEETFQPKRHCFILSECMECSLAALLTQSCFASKLNNWRVCFEAGLSEGVLWGHDPTDFCWSVTPIPTRRKNIIFIFFELPKALQGLKGS